VNSDECLLTRMQEMSLDYHFTVEQEVGSSTHAFFGFNGNHSYSKPNIQYELD
jgi:beta-mannan synthase